MTPNGLLNAISTRIGSGQSRGIIAGAGAGAVRHYAFIGLERVGGVVAYDVTNPAAPVFVDYVNNRQFSTADRPNNPGTGDRGPEGVLFIPAILSPTFKPLVVVTNEVSGTVTTYGVEVCSRLPLSVLVGATRRCED